MYEIYEKLLNQKGVKTSDVCRATGISPTVFTEWKKGKSTPKSDKRTKIANFFGVSLTFLDTGKDEEKTDVPMFDAEHVELISLYSQLKKEQKETILNLLRSFAQ